MWVFFKAWWFTYFPVLDIDECAEGITGCEQICKNNVQQAGYSCECNPGYDLNSDLKTCSLGKKFTVVTSVKSTIMSCFTYTRGDQELTRLIVLLII